MPDVDTIIAEYHGGRLCGGPAVPVLVAEIERLREEVAFLRREMQRQGERPGRVCEKQLTPTARKGRSE